MRVDFSVYLITDRRQSESGDLRASVERALRGGVRAVQLREKDLCARERYELALELRALTNAFEARLLINGDAALARAVGADGIHLPQDGLPPQVCRRLLEPRALIGVSTHSLEQAKNAEAGGADFITFGPIYLTPSKRGYGPPVGLESLRSVCRTVGLPVFALGGISASRIEEVLSAGAAGIGLISAILAAADIERAALDFSRRLSGRKPNQAAGMTTKG